MITAKEISWIRDQISKAGKVAPVDVDKLMQRLLNVLNAKLEARVLEESGLNDLLEQHKAQERDRLCNIHIKEVAKEKERLKSEFDSRAYQLELKTSERIHEAQYAESVVGAVEVILGFISKVWKKH